MALIYKYRLQRKSAIMNTNQWPSKKDAANKWTTMLTVLSFTEDSKASKEKLAKNALINYCGLREFCR